MATFDEQAVIDALSNRTLEQIDDIRTVSNPKPDVLKLSDLAPLLPLLREQEKNGGYAGIAVKMKQDEGVSLTIAQIARLDELRRNRIAELQAEAIE